MFDKICFWLEPAVKSGAPRKKQSLKSACMQTERVKALPPEYIRCECGRTGKKG